GNVSDQILIVGFFDAFIVSFIVVFITIYFVRRTSSLSEINERLQIEVNEREKSEEALRESEERLKAIFENAKEGILVVDAETKRFINANVMICQMLGYSCEEIKKLGVSDIHPEEDLPFVIKQFEKLLRQELTSAHKIPVKRKDGTVFYAEINSSPFKLGGKNYLAGFFRDITENYKLEEQLRQSQKIAAVGILAGGVAHEFSNILTTIKGSVYIIQKKLAKDDSLNKYSEQITASLNKASALAQGLLAFSRKQIVDLRPQDLSEIVMRVKNLVSSLIGEHIKLEIELAAGDRTIIADSNQIEQVLINLITNAGDAMPKGGRLTIKTDIEEIDEDFKKEHGFGVPGKYALIAVSDTGTGIPESIKEKIFEPFFTTKELGKGTGLGLSIVYGIVKQHNGYIDVDTRLNEGTTVKIYIPAVEPKSEEASIQDLPSVIGGLETILLAEDDADTREIMSEVIRAEGYTVLETMDGEDAIRKFRENKDKIHLVLLDVRMPKKDGKEVYDEIRRIRPDMKSLFISGYTADVIDNDEFSELGLNFISKSSSPVEILGKIREVLDKPV
ncbi:MAG: PAS domain S-box protein, partial [Thermodesulfovibrionales bacterium]